MPIKMKRPQRGCVEPIVGVDKVPCKESLARGILPYTLKRTSKSPFVPYIQIYTKRPQVKQEPPVRRTYLNQPLLQFLYSFLICGSLHYLTTNQVSCTISAICTSKYKNSDYGHIKMVAESAHEGAGTHDTATWVTTRFCQRTTPRSCSLVRR